MSIELPPLPYPKDALEPYISAETLKVHYGKHHKGYVDKLNALITGSRFEEMPLEDIIMESKDVHQKIFNNAAQVWNHTFLWNSMTPDPGQMSADLQAMIEEEFDSVDLFKEEFMKAGIDLFGSGYIWLTKSGAERLHIRPMKDANNPLMTFEVPLLACDVWEHAYYLDQKNDRAKYLKEFWHVANWDFAVANLAKQPIAYQKTPKRSAEVDSARH
jgi:Fe-Mn family superoxide dismutase